MATFWSDRIKGVHKKKGLRGKAIPYEPEEKAPIAIKNAAARFFEKKGFSITVVELKVESFACNKKGEPFKKEYANNSHKAAGKITYFLREHKSDKTFEKQTSQFDISFDDAMDQHGVPETVVNEFKLS